MSLRRKKKILPRIKGKLVRSDFEYKVYQQLLDILPKGAVIEYEAERIPYIIHHEYVPDFTITLKDGRKIRIEAKGNGRQFDHAARAKLLAVKEQHPELAPKIVFYGDGKIGRKRKDGSFLKQSDWGNKYRYPYSIKEINPEWFK